MLTFQIYLYLGRLNVQSLLYSSLLMLQFTRQLERAQVAQLQLKQELASQQVQSQLRIAQVGEIAHRDIAHLTESRDMLTAVCSHLANDVRQALEAAEGIAGSCPSCGQGPGWNNASKTTRQLQQPCFSMAEVWGDVKCVQDHLTVSFDCLSLCCIGQYGKQHLFC